MVDILVTGSIVFTGERFLRNGYVYLRDGRIDSVGEAPVPEEYTYATLILGGPGRVIVPGLAALASVAAYPIRLKSPSMGGRVRFYADSDLKTLILSSLPAVYELHMSGVTTIIIEGLTPELPLELSRLVGGFYGLAVPVCSGVEPRYVPGLASAITIAGPECEGEAEVVEVDGRGFKGSSRLLSVFGGVSYTISKANSENPWAEGLELRRALSLPPPSIKPGRVAEIAVYDVSRPPAMLLDMAGEREILGIYTSGARLETLIAGEDVLVDTGEHLYIVEKHFNEVRRLAEKLAPRRTR